MRQDSRAFGRNDTKVLLHSLVSSVTVIDAIEEDASDRLELQKNIVSSVGQ